MGDDLQGNSYNSFDERRCVLLGGSLANDAAGEWLRWEAASRRPDLSATRPIQVMLSRPSTYRIQLLWMASCPQKSHPCTLVVTLARLTLSIRYPVRVKMNLALISATVITLFGIFEGTDGAPTHEKHLERRVVVGIAPIKITTPPPKKQKTEEKKQVYNMGPQAYVYTGEFE
ncbi:hypothetical protein PSTT_07037 [Puccinia striiformis]|uniref:Uncharacterized protein n=1 Tax=Puccinia striiformis TaxID=27350 RepID=A0A2S4VI25_9BASI|nr:hypothetical protein PSTT_07037 [Puccinia striiformis]